METFDIEINLFNEGPARFTLSVDSETGPTRAGNWQGENGAIFGTFLAHADEDLTVLNLTNREGAGDPTVYVLSGSSGGGGIFGTVSNTTDNGSRPAPITWRRLG